MASIVVSGDTSGAITVSAPAVAGSNTLTLPAATTTLVGLTTTDTLTNKTLTSPIINTIYSNATNTPVTFADSGGTQVGTLCRAWVNYNGVTPAIKASFNVTSVTRNSTSNYTINFTNAISDVNYAWSGSLGYDNISQQGWVSSPSSVAMATWKTTTSLNVIGVYANGTSNSNYNDFSIMVFR